jgi:beta-lactamase class A
VRLAAAFLALTFQTVPVRAQLAEIAGSSQGRIGASAVILEDSSSVVFFHDAERFPMQSVYKLPIGMTILRDVDRGKLRLDAEVHVDKSEYLRFGHSPLRDAHPEGATVSLRELLRLAVSESDGSASDVLLRLVGGAQAVMSYLRDAGVNEVEVRDTERRISEDYAIQFKNWATPNGAIKVLRALHESRGLSPSSRALLLQFMTVTTTFPTRIKGLLPATALVVHKTGTSGTRNGLTAATNDIGIVMLPDGRHLAIAVFVSDSKADDATRDAVIARIAKAAWNEALKPPHRAVAITIDDLPRGGDGGPPSFDAIQDMTTRLLTSFREHHVPLTGFVHGGVTELTPAELRLVLDLWLDAGADLGNHTYSHIDLNTTPVAEYEQNIIKGEPILRAALQAHGKQLEFFRFPFLHSGPDAETKHAIAQFLAAHGYRNAPVTFDNSDYMFAAAYLKPQLSRRVKQEYLPYLESVVAFFEQRSVEVAGREFPQILLLHASELNAQMMPAILDMFRRRGYKFVSLGEALRDPVYQIPENYVGRGGFSWIHRWSMAKGMPGKGEPDEPEWVRTAFQAARR